MRRSIWRGFPGWVLATLWLWSWGSGAAAAVAGWRQDLNVAGSSGWGSLVAFGVATTATDSLDLALGEQERPPLPPSGSADVRFTGARMGQGSMLDLRPVAGTHTLTLQIQRAAANDTLIIGWDPVSLAARTTSAVIKDPFGGVLLSANMRSQHQLIVTNTFFTSLMIEFTSAAVTEPAPPAQVVWTLVPDSLTSGQALTPPLAVAVRDSLGHGVSGVSLALTLVSGQGTLSGTLSRTTDSTGAAVFTGVAYTAANGDTTAVFRASVTTPALHADSAPVFVRPQPPLPARQLVWLTVPTRVVSGDTLAPAVRVALRDSLGGGVAGLPVTLNLSQGQGSLLGSLTQFSDSTGTATFADLTYRTAHAESGVHLQASAVGAGLSSESGAISVSLPAATQLTVTQVPALVRSDRAFAPAVVVVARDSAGEGVADVPVTLALTRGHGTLAGTLTQLTGTDGAALFDDLVYSAGAVDTALVLQASVASPTLRASSGRIPLTDAEGWFETLMLKGSSGWATALTFGAKPGATDSLDLDLGEVERPPLPPSGTLDARFIGTGLGNGVQLDLRAMAGEHVLTLVLARPVYTDTVVVEWDPSAVAAATSMATISGPQGLVVPITDMRTTGRVVIVNPSVARLEIRFRTAGTAGPLPPAQLLFTQVPPLASPGQALSPAVQVQVLDSLGVGVVDVPVTLALGAGTGSLSGTLTQSTGVDGIAMFPDLAYAPAAGEISFTLRATTTAPSLADTSAAIGMAAPGGWRAGVTVSGSSGWTGQVFFGAVPGATDSLDANLGELERPPLPPVGNADVRFTGTGLGNGVQVDLRAPQGEHLLTLGAQWAEPDQYVVFSWDSSAIAAVTQSAFLIDPSGVVFAPVDMRSQDSLVVPWQNLTAVQIRFQSLADSSLPPARVQFAQVPVLAAPGAPFSPPVVVSVSDSLGNPVANTAVSLALATGQGSLTGTLSQNTNLSGQAVFADLAYTPAAGETGFTLRATTIATSRTATSNRVQVAGSEGWFRGIAVRGSSGWGAVVTFGAMPGATDSLDAALGELERPPLPPAGNPDSRFTGVTLGNGVQVDLRAPQGEHVLDLATQWADDDGYVTLSWDSTAVAAVTLSAYLSDPAAGTFAPVDMRARGHLVLDNAAVQVVRLVFRSIDDVSRTPAQIRFGQIPALAAPGRTFTPPVVVAVSDSLGAPVVGAAVHLEVGAGQGQLSGTLTQASGMDGLAVFGDVGYVPAAGETGFALRAWIDAPSLSAASNRILIAGGDGWFQGLSLRGSSGWGAVLTFGAMPGATDTLDAGLGELERPPLPPQDLADARFTGTGLGDGLQVDLRAMTGLHTLTVAVQRAGQTDTAVVLSWDQAAVAAATSLAVLMDPYTGEMIRVDMRSTGQLVLGPGAPNTLLLQFRTKPELTVAARLWASPHQVTVGDTVAFADSSSGPVISRTWDFGDGSSSDLATPSHAYLSAGDFAVRLTVRGDADSSVAIDTIRVAPPRVEARLWASPHQVTVGDTVAFADSSTGPVVSRTWDFGDGAGSDLATPAHAYLTAGDYVVRLTVRGAADSSVAADTIRVAPPLVAARLWASAHQITVGDSVAFADNSTGPVVSRTWDFGDGSRSDLATPAHAYLTVGDFVVRLTVRGLADSSVAADTIRVAPLPLRARVWASTHQVTVGDTVAFADSSTGPVISRTWDFGDGGSSDLAAPSHSYTTVGTFAVRLTVRGVADSSVAVDTIRVAPVPVHARLWASPHQVTVGDTVAFADSSSGPVVSRSWAFGDGGSSDRATPTHSYAAAGTFVVRLTVRGVADSSVAVDTIRVAAVPVQARLWTLLPKVVVGDTVAFADSSSGPVISRTWEFGDGATSDLARPRHVYTAVGAFTVRLTVRGVADSSIALDTIQVVPVPVQARFSVSSHQPIVGDSVAFADSSSGPVVSRAWTFGDGATSDLARPRHAYTAVGTFVVRLTVRGVADSSVAVDTIHVVPVPVQAHFWVSSHQPIVGDSVAFADSSSGPVVSRAWIFGDGATSDLARPRHAYTTVGTFVVRLTVRGVADSSVAVDTIHVAPVPVRARIWLASRQLTVGDSVAFADSSSGPVASRTWTFGDGGSSSLASGRHRYTSSGTFVVGLTVRGVADSSLAADTVKVSPVPVRAKFGQSALQVLTNASVTFTDSSTGPILSRTWAFGDGGTSTQTSPSHSYTAAGTYTVVLTVRGATDSSQATGTMKVVAGLVTLKLAAEFNLVSWPIDTPNDSVEAIIRPILSDVIQVQGFETANIKPSGGGTGAKVYTPTGGLYNTLKKTDHRLGYWIRMRAARTLQITGVPVYADTVAVPLAANFNLVGYLPSFGDSVRFAVTSLSGKLVQVQGFQTSQWPIAPFKHTSTGAKIYTPTGGLYNTLKFMSPQCGYWVKLTAVDTLIWQRAAGPGVPATPAARLLASAGDEAGPFAAEPVTPTSRWVVVYGQVLAADGQPAGAGTVVDVVDATGNVAGWFQVEQPGVYGYLPVYLDDPTSPLDEGAEVGEWLTLRVNGVATETRVQWTQDSELIQINLVAPPTPTAVVGALPPAFALHPVYPNPFNPSATIHYDLAKAEFVHLKLYSLTGQLVRELVSAWQPAGSYEVRWDGLDGDRRAVANGTYLCQLETPSDRAVRRMVLMK